MKKKKALKKSTDIVNASCTSLLSRPRNHDQHRDQGDNSSALCLDPVIIMHLPAEKDRSNGLHSITSRFCSQTYRCDSKPWKSGKEIPHFSLSIQSLNESFPFFLPNIWRPTGPPPPQTRPCRTNQSASPRVHQALHWAAAWHGATLLFGYEVSFFVAWMFGCFVSLVFCVLHGLVRFCWFAFFCFSLLICLSVRCWFGFRIFVAWFVVSSLVWFLLVGLVFRSPWLSNWYLWCLVAVVSCLKVSSGACHAIPQICPSKTIYEKVYLLLKSEHPCLTSEKTSSVLKFPQQNFAALSFLEQQLFELWSIFFINKTAILGEKKLSFANLSPAFSGAFLSFDLSQKA